MQLSLTSASSAFFNTRSFFPFSSSLSLCPLYVPPCPEMAGVSSSRVSSPRQSPLSSSSSTAYFACKSNWTGTLPTHTARIFRLLIFDQLLAIDQGNTEETRGNSVIGRQPSTLILLLSLSLSLALSSSLDVFCVRKYFDKYLCSCSGPRLCPKTPELL